MLVLANRAREREFTQTRRFRTALREHEQFNMHHYSLTTIGSCMPRSNSDNQHSREPQWVQQSKM